MAGQGLLQAYSGENRETVRRITAAELYGKSGKHQTQAGKQT